MRIVHVCLAQFYIDGFGYQENILPRIHAETGHDVTIVASTETYVGNTKLAHVAVSSYRNEDGIEVHRLPYSSWVPRPIRSKIRAYRGLTTRLEELRPDLIFVHDVQFYDFLKIAKYARRSGAKVVADCHADYVNSARDFISRHILHAIFYRWIVRRVDWCVSRYWATLPIRSTFLQEMYGLPANKIELLPFGVDDRGLGAEQRMTLRRQTRAAMGIPENAKVLVTGGKLDLRKNIHLLVDVFSSLRREGRLENMHLIVFGQPDAEVRERLAGIDIGAEVKFAGWIRAPEISSMLLAGDLAIFPGTHSVLWEQAIGLGLPTVFHLWPGMEHLDLDGNALFIDDANRATLEALLEKLALDDGPIPGMAAIAGERGPKHFTYSAIAAKALEIP